MGTPTMSICNETNPACITDVERVDERGMSAHDDRHGHHALAFLLSACVDGHDSLLQGRNGQCNPGVGTGDRPILTTCR